MPATLHIENTQTRLSLGQQQKLHAYLQDKGKKTDVTQQAKWTTNNPVIISVDHKGSIIAKGEGSGEITASFKARYATTQITVTASAVQRVEIQPTNTHIHVGEELQYHATGFYSDNSAVNLTDSVEWTAANKKIISINSQGLAKALSAGSTQLTGKDPSSKQKGTTPITINSSPLQKLDILSKQLSLGVGVSENLLARATFTDGDEKNISKEATWHSDNVKIASVDSNGLVTGKSAGSTTVQATFGDQAQKSHVQVIRRELSAIRISPQNACLPKGLTAQYEAFAIYTDEHQENITINARWSTENESIATMNAAAHALGVSQGNTQVNAYFDGKMGEATLKITLPALTSMHIYPNSQDHDFTIGMKRQLNVKGVYNNDEIADMTQNVTWTSQYPEILSVIPIGEKAGLATGKGEGIAKITAYDPASKQSTSMTYQIQGVPLEGIQISPQHTTVPKMNILPFKATGHFSDGKNRDMTTNVFWISSKPTVADVSQQGYVTTKTAGMTTISAEYKQKMASTAVEVLAAEGIKKIIISPSSATIRPVSGLQFQATVTFNNGHTLDITETGEWASTNPYIVSIWHTPWLHGQAWAWGVNGTTEISITYKGMTASVPLTVAR